MFLDLDHVNWMPLNDPTNQVVHTEDGTAVHAVMVAGRMVVQDRRPVGVDLERLSAKVEAARERLQAFNEPAKGLCDSLSTIVNAFCPGLAKTPYRINRYGCGCMSSGD